MKKEKYWHYIIWNFLLAFFLCISIEQILERGTLSRLSETTVESEGFRSQPIDESTLGHIEKMENPGEWLALYWLENDFGTKKDNISDTFIQRKEKWSSRPQWEEYKSACTAIWDDLVYFPIPKPSNNVNAKVTYENSWMFSRTYKGERRHEGTDLMPSINRRGYYPVVSMTDGTVTQKGWLELGGYRLGIETSQGVYFYYAHLESYAEIEVGDTVKAGQLLGYMGDTGYSKKEGTTGNFPVHLHVGIYLLRNGKEISVNPYPVLRYLEKRRIECVY